jgi:hypothetical protein
VGVRAERGGHPRTAGRAHHRFVSLFSNALMHQTITMQHHCHRSLAQCAYW